MNNKIKLFLASITLILGCQFVGPNTPAQTLVAAQCHSPERWHNQIVGDGHCVALIKSCTNLGLTHDWRKGANLYDQQGGRIVAEHQAEILPGSVIATFANGRYPSESGYHAAIYIRHDNDGLWVWDQFKGKAVSQRFIRVRSDHAEPGNTAQAYALVLP